MPARDPYRRIYRVLRLNGGDSGQQQFHKEELEGPVSLEPPPALRRQLPRAPPPPPSGESFAERLQRLQREKGRK